MMRSVEGVGLHDSEALMEFMFPEKENFRLLTS